MFNTNINVIEKKYHEEQATKLFECVAEKLKDFNSGLVNGIEDRLESDHLV